LNNSFLKRAAAAARFFFVRLINWNLSLRSRSLFSFLSILLQQSPIPGWKSPFFLQKSHYPFPTAYDKII